MKLMHLMVVEHEVAWGGYSNNPIIDAVVHGFGRQSHHRIYDWGGAALQNIYRTIALEWSSKSHWTPEVSTILITYMVEYNILATLYKLLCTTQYRSPTEGLFIWRNDKEGKVMLPGGEPKPSKPITMNNAEDIIMCMSSFIQYWDRHWIADVGGSFCYRFGTWIGYWTHFCSNLMDLHQHSPFTLRHGFRPQSHVHVHVSQAGLL